MGSSPSSYASHLSPADLGAEAQRMLEKEKLAALAEFAAGAAHEINNPLTVISGRAQLLLRDERDPERRRALLLIISQASRIHEMIADLMLFARPPQPEMKIVDLTALLDEVAAEFSSRCAEQRTELCRRGLCEPLRIKADPVQLYAALQAVCRNALEALQTGGHLEIELSETNWSSSSASPTAGQSKSRLGGLNESQCTTQDDNTDYLSTRFARILIRDDGPGISPEERCHIFDPFYSARQAGRGLGLGLAKAWRIATNHGGWMEVKSEPGKGAAFIFFLPLPDSQ